MREKVVTNLLSLIQPHLPVLQMRKTRSRKIKFIPLVVKRTRLTVQETRVRSLGREDPLQKEMATHSSVLAWKIPLSEEPGRLQSMG